MVSQQFARLAYTYPLAALRAGASFGNLHAFARLDAQTDLKGLWSSIDNQFVAGEWNLSFEVEGGVIEPAETVFRPESQRTVCRSGSWTFEKEFFLPFSSSPETDNLRAAIFIVRLRSSAAVPAKVSIRQKIVFPALKNPLFTKQPPEEESAKRFTIREGSGVIRAETAGKPEEVRLFGSMIHGASVSYDDTTLDAVYYVRLEPSMTMEIPFVLAFSHEGFRAAEECFRASLNAAALLEQTREALDELLQRSLIRTPDPMINRGLQWAKVNMLRVQHEYHAGFGFTNDPPQDIVVIRDLAWYVLGSDYLTPEFSRGLVKFAEDHAYHGGGKLTEYLHAGESSPEQHDYDLNINDDTPLFVWALWHHALAAGGVYDLDRVYGLMKLASDWIIAQIEGGLVRCHTGGTSVRGICSWRNIIDGYNLSGAVTEVNAECAFALGLTAQVAHAIGKNEDARFYEGAAGQLKEALNSLLLSEKTSMYLLNISDDGVRHHDITGDLVFPVLFDIADDAMARRILDRLTMPDIWTPFGERTVAPGEPLYDPDFGYQLVGGAWPNLAVWVAYCLRRRNPEKLIEGMRNIYALSEVERPVDYVNVVPGEFPERLHGTTFESRGMTMSPWTPPTYLWLGVEGLAGVEPGMNSLKVNPAMPASWKWLSLQNMPYQGESVSLFVHEGTIYATRAVESDSPVNVGIKLPVDSDAPEFTPFALEFGNEVQLFVGCDEGGKGTVTIRQGERKITEGVTLKPGEVFQKRYAGM